MAKVGKASALRQRMLDAHDELLAGISDYSDQIYGNLLLRRGIADPRPCDFVAAGLELRFARATNGLPEPPRDVVVGAFLWLVPDFER